MSVADGNPPYSEPTRAFGAVEDADATRQAQHTRANDSPTDVNNNAALARSQSLTTDLLGKAFGANSDRRDKLADIIMGKMGLAAA